MIKTELLKNVSHGFFTKDGGVSKNEFESLNCSYYNGDVEDLVTQNLEIVRNKMNAKVLFTLKQVHGNDVIIVDKSNISQYKQTLEADALITQDMNICLGILTADCAPVLIYGTGIIAAVHCGWKSAKLDIIANVVSKISKLSPHVTLSAAIGPCAHVESYTVQNDFIERFNDKRFFDTYSDGVHFDLVRYVQAKLQQSGIQQIAIIDEDTVANTTNFFSYRRAQKHTNGICGRQISVIMLE